MLLNCAKTTVNRQIKNLGYADFTKFVLILYIYLTFMRFGYIINMKLAKSNPETIPKG